MRKVLFYFIGILICFIVNVSFIKAVECNYTAIECVDEDGQVIKSNADYSIHTECKFIVDQGNGWIKLNSYNKGEGSYTIGGGETLQNWDKKEYCPNTIRVTWAEWYDIFDDREWYGYEDLESVRDAGESYDYIYIYDKYLEELKEGLPEFDTTVNYTCSYEGFDISYNKDGYALSAVDTADYYDIVRFFYLSDRLTREASPTPGVCQDVHYCQESFTGSGPYVYSYRIFADEFDYSANKSKCTNYFIGGIINGGTDSYDNGCRTYSKYIGTLESLWPICEQDKGQCENYNTLKKEISEICNDILKFSNYSSDCLKACLDYKDEVLRIENTTLEPLKCGFSAKFAQWIANIIRWGKYLIPVVVIVLGILDFIKAIAADKDDEMKKAQGRFIKRLIAAALIFIIPFIIEFVLGKLGFDSNGCGIIDL